MSSRTKSGGYTLKSAIKKHNSSPPDDKVIAEEVIGKSVKTRIEQRQERSNEDEITETEIGTREAGREQATASLEEIMEAVGNAEGKLRMDKRTPMGAYVFSLAFQAAFSSFLVSTIMIIVNNMCGGFSVPGVPVADRFVRALFFGLVEIIPVLLCSQAFNDAVETILYQWADMKYGHIPMSAMTSRCLLSFLDIGFSIGGMAAGAATAGWFITNEFGPVNSSTIPTTNYLAFFFEALAKMILLGVLAVGYIKSHNYDAFDQASKQSPNKEGMVLKLQDSDVGQFFSYGVSKGFFQGKMHKEAMRNDRNGIVLAAFIALKVIFIFILQPISPTFLNFNVTLGYAIYYSSAWNMNIWVQLVAQFSGMVLVGLYIHMRASDKRRKMNKVKKLLIAEGLLLEPPQPVY